MTTKNLRNKVLNSICHLPELEWEKISGRKGLKPFEIAEVKVDNYIKEYDWECVYVAGRMIEKGNYQEIFPGDEPFIIASKSLPKGQRVDHKNQINRIPIYTIKNYRTIEKLY